MRGYHREQEPAFDQLGHEDTARTVLEDAGDSGGVPVEGLSGSGRLTIVSCNRGDARNCLVAPAAMRRVLLVYEFQVNKLSNGQCSRPSRTKATLQQRGFVSQHQEKEDHYHWRQRPSAIGCRHMSGPSAFLWQKRMSWSRRPHEVKTRQGVERLGFKNCGSSSSQP